MSNLLRIQEAIIEESSSKPIKKGFIRRNVKVRDEEFRINHPSFDAQIESLVDMGIMREHQNGYFSLTEEGDMLSADIFGN